MLWLWQGPQGDAFIDARKLELRQDIKLKLSRAKEALQQWNLRDRLETLLGYKVVQGWS